MGVPWTGEPGITETVAEIMARERFAPKVDASRPRPTKPEIDLRKLLPQRQASGGMAVPRWPMLDRTLAAPRPFNPQTVGTSFLGIHLFESGFIPPDSMGDVGPTQILVAANGRIKVFDKNGVLGGLNVGMDTFFNSVRDGWGTSDPHVRYDRLSGRWFITIINVPVSGSSLNGPNRVLIAVSSGSTITNGSSFTFFQFQQDAVGSPGPDLNGFADYETLGVDKFALYIGVNMFNQNGSAFLGTTGFVVNKADLIDDGILNVTAFRQMAGSGCPSGAGPVTPQGVNNDDPSATEGYFIGVDLCLFNLLQIRRVSNPGGTPTLSGNLAIAVPMTRYPIDQVQPGGAPSLDALDDRLFAAAIHKNKITGASTLWTAHNIQVNATGVAIQCGTPGVPPFPLCPDGRNASRWYEIGSLTTTPALIQSGTLFDPAASNPLGYWIPSVAMSGQGHMALGASRASAVGGTGPGSGHASISVAGRLRTDGLGATQSPTLAVDSDFRYDVFTSPQTDPERWGDYSQVGIDPNDDMTMWTFQEYTNATNSWGVQALRLIAPPPATPASASPPTVATGQPSVNVVITGTSVSGSEFFDPGPDAGGPGFPNHIAAAVSGNVTVNSVTFNSPTQVTLNISTVGATLGAANVTITNPDGQSSVGTSILTILPALAINDVAVAEGNGGTTNAVFTVSLSPANPSQTVTVNYATSDGTAIAGSDYTAAMGTVTFPPGSTSQPVTISVLGDLTFEPAETFFVNLSMPVNAAIADSQGIGTINNDDPQPSISISDVAVAEGNAGTTNAVFTVSLSNPSSQTVNVDYGTANGTANAGSDYAAGSGTITFSPGETTRPLNVTILGDVLDESDETFFVNLSSPSGATISDGQGMGTIVDDDTSMVSISDTSLLEGVGGTTTATFTVSLSNPSVQTVTVPYSTADGTANAGSDYTAASGMVTFAPGEVSQLVLVTVSGDTATEPNETFFVDLGPPTNATLADGQGVGTIVNDDPPGPSAFADFLMMGQVHPTSVSNVTPTRWFKVRLVADRSYAASAWAPTTDASESPVSLDVAWFLDDGVTAAAGVDTVEREPTPDASDHNGDAESIIPTAGECAVPTGCTYRVRLQATGATTGIPVDVMIVETTMVSPYWQVATAAGYDAAPQIRNNTSSSVPVTFTAYGNTGTVVCSNTILMPANGLTTFGISGAAPGCGIASGFGSAQIAFHGPPGSITANITTFSALSGLSFDSPFSPRNTWTSLRPN